MTSPSKNLAVLASMALALSSPSLANEPDREGAVAVLAAYRTALERLSLSGTESLFAADATIIESGKREGNFAAYKEHHLGPELKELKSFSFGDYNTEVKVEGALAMATETYTYHIVLKSGSAIDRRGATTSVLKWDGSSWRIVVSHSSSRSAR